MYLEYYIIIIATNFDSIYELSSNFHTKTASQFYKIISDIVYRYICTQSIFKLIYIKYAVA